MKCWFEGRRSRGRKSSTRWCMRVTLGMQTIFLFLALSLCSCLWDGEDEKSDVGGQVTRWRAAVAGSELCLRRLQYRRWRSTPRGQRATQPPPPSHEPHHQQVVGGSEDDPAAPQWISGSGLSDVANRWRTKTKVALAFAKNACCTAY